MMWVWTSMPWITPDLSRMQSLANYTQARGRRHMMAAPLNGGVDETLVHARCRGRPRRCLRPPDRSDAGDRPAHVRPQLRRIDDDRHLALVTRRQRGPAGRVRQQLLPDPAREGLD